MKIQQLGLTSEEQNLFAEVSNILSKYEGKTREFGLFDVHTHFPIEEDETLYETNSPQSRTHTVVVKKKTQVGNAKPTQWIVKKNSVKVFQYCCD